MYIKKRALIAVLSTLITFVISGMEQSKKTIIEKKREKYLEQCGTIDAPPHIQELNQGVLSLYIKKGYLHKDTAILVKYMNPQIIASLKKDGCATWNNAFNNGYDLIHVGEQHDELPEEAVTSRLAHEQAHMALEQNAYLNPHYYMRNIHLWGLGIGCTAALFCVAPLVASCSKKPLRAFTAVGLTCASGTATSFYLDKHVEERWDLPNKSPNRLLYPFLQKFVEIECDIIAASTLPKGGRAGKMLYTKSLVHNGNTNGINGDHPYTTTRIWYHSMIELWQDYCAKKKEKPDIK